MTGVQTCALPICYPHELSGGQRQRLALARALAPGSSLVLLDEPFSNLDVEVRLRLRAELPGVLARCGASGLIVTHDPEEALAICDRVAVLESGHLHQCASPREMVETPATAFVRSSTAACAVRGPHTIPDTTAAADSARNKSAAFIIARPPAICGRA